MTSRSASRRGTQEPSKDVARPGRTSKLLGPVVPIWEMGKLTAREWECPRSLSGIRADRCLQLSSPESGGTFSVLT